MSSAKPKIKINKIKFDIVFPKVKGVLRIDIPDIPFKEVKEVWRANPKPMFGEALGTVAWRGNDELGLFAKDDLEWMEDGEYYQIKPGVQAFGILKEPPSEGFQSASLGSEGPIWSTTQGDGIWILREYRII